MFELMGEIVEKEYTIESLKKKIKEEEEEIEKLNNIIKEVRKYIKDNFSNEDKTIWHEDMGKILRILNKEKRND